MDDRIDYRIDYRKAQREDAAAISQLILETQLAYSVETFSEQGKALLQDICSPPAIEHYLARGDIYYVATQGRDIVGVIGIRDTHHIAHNFVLGRHHGLGIANELWRLGRTACLEAGNPGSFELRASTYAIPVYERWGFVATGVAEDTGGIISTPMRLDL